MSDQARRRAEVVANRSARFPVPSDGGFLVATASSGQGNWERVKSAFIGHTAHSDRTNLGRFYEVPKWREGLRGSCCDYLPYPAATMFA